MTRVPIRIPFCGLVALAGAMLLWPTPSPSQAGREFFYCIGEDHKRCPPDTQHYPCGQSVEQVAQEICTSRGPGGPLPLRYYFSLMYQHDGDECGYNVARVTCLAR